ncbi:nitrite reductase (NADH) large subunit [Sinobacterium caligoides]|uniref:Nitrite reductase (NADH) large subunit n=1 Tax=Sinobacterium caligoides TaxID=933926 RepID=A0A3N2DNM4_9GAMM|nr:nitrite reductase large subunit NirB [Sinobacterium caligoides]ROS01390.1 nitrite reductase (NADH) large subunit [Sinobacterium caligoides]
MSTKIKLVLVGNGPVGHQFLETLVDNGSIGNFDITVFGEEPRAAYDRVQLTKWFETRTAEPLNMVSEGFYESNAITCHHNAEVTDIDRDNQQVIIADGQSFPYDKLILATGSFPFVPPVPGHDRENCFVYRTIEDLEAITEASKKASVGVVIGGGLLGLEAAKALKDLDLKTHVVEFAPRLMAVQVDDNGGKLLRQKIEDLGVGVHTEKNTQNIGDGEECVHKMIFADDSELETDIIVFSAGIRPQDALARSSELEIGPRGGIVIDNDCLTSDKNIYAIGECALWEGRIYGLIAPGNDMARVAAGHVSSNGEAQFTGADMSTKLKLMGVDVASIGDAHANTPGSKCYTYIDEQAEVYKKIVVSEDGKHLLGSVLIGDAEDYSSLLQYSLNKIELPENPDSMILPSYDGSSGVALGADALPDSAQICSCNNVSKGDINGVVQSGCCTIGEVKDATKAGTTCGGCVALVGQVMNAELTKLGVEVNTDLCEHFAYTRQEMYHLVRVGKIKTFDEMLEKHGKGKGCDICKPTTASILATCWNDHILDEPLGGLQDTNDRFLANMQKDGTFSVVPRMPGGEVTADGLIAIGQVAKDFNLYTKITGGQRVDLFGATADQLPLVWEKLIAAGFESGHAYGKSLRTVKSCVGSTWCRYGVQDSMGQAIDIENRYKGLRSPHKLKMAVSGCTRECAEAQSKDVGIIATEKGWNMYVCGNGGMKPRHADLFASDLDDETLVKYIDRFFMFYIRTADRLQRTSTWMDNLEGGLSYLQDVVINDSLGICDELESEMQSVINTYQCEWKTAIENESKVKQFRSFINSDKKDDNIVFIEERGQIRPATTVEKADLIAKA